MGKKSCKVNHERKRRHLPYGAIRKRHWCWGCDADLVPPEPKKKAARQKVKLQIKKILQDVD